jgi:hypothetical protein
MAESNPFDQFDPKAPTPTTETQPVPPAAVTPAPSSPGGAMTADEFVRLADETHGREEKMATGAIKTMGSITTGAVKGVVKGAIHEPAKFLNENLWDLGGIVIDRDGVRFSSGKDANKKTDELLKTDADAPIAEHVADGVGQFIGAWLLAGKLISGARGVQYLSTGGKVVRGMEQGALADIIGFDPRQGRLSNLIERIPELRNPITAYLASNPDDPDAEGRFKNALEGSIIGGSLSAAVFGVVKLVKMVRSAPDEATAAKIIEAAEPELKQAEAALSPPRADVGATPHSPTHSAIEKNWKLYDPDKTLAEPGNKAFREAVEKELGKPDGWSLSDAGGFKEFTKAVRETDQLLPKAAPEAAAPKVTLGPSIRVGNDTFVGKAGETHGDVYSRIPEAKLNGGNIVEGFSDAAGKFYTRIEAAEVLGIQRKPTKLQGRPGAHSGDLIPPKEAEVPAAAPAPNMKALVGKLESEPSTVVGTSLPTAKTVALVNPKEADDFIRAIATGAKPIVPESMPGRTLFNFSKMDSPEEAHAIIKAGAEAMSGSIGKYAKEGVYSLRQMEQDAGEALARMVDGDLDLVMSSVRARAASMKDAVAEHLAAKTLMQELARDITTFSAKIERGLDTTDRAKLVQRIQQLIDVSNAVKGVQAQAARVTGAGRIRTGEDAIPELLQSLAKGGQNDAALKDLAYKLQAAAGDPKAILRTVRTANTPLQMHNTIWRAALLANYDTHVVNTTANLVHTLAMPAELAMGKVAQGVLKGDLGAAWRGAQDAAHIYVGMMKTWKDSARMTAKVLLSKDGRPVLDATSKFDEAEIAAKLTGLTDERTAFETVTKTAAQFVNLPYRALATEDEWFKQVAYRGHLYSQLWRQGADQGLKGRQLADFIESNFEKAFSPTGQGLNKDALNFAQASTFSTPHPKGSWGQSVQMFSYRHPTTALVAPFIRTPANLLRRTWDWTPGLNMLRGKFRSDFLGHNGVERQAEAMGAMSMGIMLYGVAVDMALSGQTTGSLVTGYSDTANSVRKVKQMGGELPFSHVFTHADGEKTYRQFSRLDPYASVFGLAADAVALIKAGADEATMDELAGSAILSIANNLTSKSYMAGFAQFFQALSDDHRAAAFVKQRAGSYVPGFMSQIATFAGEGDPYVRETRELWDGAISRTPGLSSTLKPQVNWFTGEDIQPLKSAFLPEGFKAFAMNTTRGKHPAMVELARISYPGRKPEPIIGNVRLTTDQQYEFYKLIANPPDAQPLIEAIWEYMKSPKYQELKDKDPTFFRYKGYEDPRHQDIALLISKYRKQAEGLLIEKYPELGTELEKDFINKGRARQGQTDLEQLLQPRKK